jgi:hypothetical protein
MLGILPFGFLVVLDWPGFRVLFLTAVGVGTLAVALASLAGRNARQPDSSDRVVRKLVGFGVVASGTSFAAQLLLA